MSSLPAVPRTTRLPFVDLGDRAVGVRSRSCPPPCRRAGCCSGSCGPGRRSARCRGRRAQGGVDDPAGLPGARGAGVVPELGRDRGRGGGPVDLAIRAATRLVRVVEPNARVAAGGAKLGSSQMTSLALGVMWMLSGSGTGRPVSPSSSTEWRGPRGRWVTSDGTPPQPAADVGCRRVRAAAGAVEVEDAGWSGRGRRPPAGRSRRSRGLGGGSSASASLPAGAV